MSAPFDAIVVGAGHNGLAAAALLAKGGRKVVVLERGERTGGLAASREFHPGYRSGGLLHDTSAVRRGALGSLDLERHGLAWRERRPALLASRGGGDGSSLLLGGDPEAAARSIERHSPTDAARYAEFAEWVARVRPVVRAHLDHPPADLVGLGKGEAWNLLRRALPLRLLGGTAMLELLRVPPMCVADWLDEWFVSDLLKASLALPAVAGGFFGPRSPGTAANLLLQETAAEAGVRGDGPALVRALERAALAAGAEVRTSAAVERIVVEGNAIRGVELAGGERIGGSLVAAACDPKQLFLQLLEPDVVGWRLHRYATNLRARGTTARLLLALKGRVSFAGRPGERIALARTASSLDALERAFDPVKYRRIPEAPVLEIHVPTVETPALAPDGCDVVSAHVHFVPHSPEPSWDADGRRLLLDRALSTLERHAPGVSSLIAHAELETPADIERRHGCSGGQIHHGEHALDQLLVRPAPGCTGYRTPIEGLWLCGSGSHPGGGLTCLPGALAAKTILKPTGVRAHPR